MADVVRVGAHPPARDQVVARWSLVEPRVLVLSCCRRLPRPGSRDRTTSSGCSIRCRSCLRQSADVSFINDDDRVLSVTIGGESVAYPVRLMAYHHLVEDTVGGTPIVATY